MNELQPAVAWQSARLLMLGESAMKPDYSSMRASWPYFFFRVPGSSVL